MENESGQRYECTVTTRFSDPDAEREEFWRPNPGMLAKGWMLVSAEKGSLCCTYWWQRPLPGGVEPEEYRSWYRLDGGCTPEDCRPSGDGWYAEDVAVEHCMGGPLGRVLWRRYSVVKPESLPHHGLKRNRFDREPREKEFADRWEAIQRPDERGRGTLEHILSTTNEPVSPNARDRQVAATVIQWLGSTIGGCFLEGLGYERTGEPEEIRD